MALYNYKTAGVCCGEIQFEIDGENKIRRVVFLGGCPGNLQAISKLVEGQDAKQISALLAGNDCGGKGTSCADQLSRAITAALARQEK